MKIIDLLNELEEQFIDYVKPRNSKKAVGVWKNPSKKELKELTKEEHPMGLRFFIDFKGEDVYVFNANLLHDEAISKTNRGNFDFKRLVKGYAENSGKVEEKKSFKSTVAPKHYEKALKILKKGSLFL